MIGGEKRDMWCYTQPNKSNHSIKTHRLKYRHDERREKRYVHAYGSYSQPNTSKNSVKTYILKHRHEKRKEICGGYSQLNTLNNSMKSHVLK